MRLALVLLVTVGLCACHKKNIADEYPAEVSAIATPGKGLPYLVGQDLRPVWDTSNTPQPRELLPFKLKDQAGRDFSLDSLKGKVAIVSFFFSKCPGICPMTTRNLRTVQSKFKGNDNVIMLSLSITPEHDTPKVLAKYAKDNEIDGRRWHLLTGSREEIYQLARASFSADTFSAKENSQKKLSAKDFLHSENIYLLDNKQKLRGIYAGIREESLADLARDAEELLQ